MKRAERIMINRFIASILLAIISLYYSSSTMFGHTHEIEGATIIHSHFHNNDHCETSNGGHTSDELALIEHLTFINFLSGEEINFECKEIAIHTQYNHPTDESGSLGERYAISAPRAPPTL